MAKLSLNDLSMLGRRWYSTLRRFGYSDIEMDYDQQLQGNLTIISSSGFWKDGFRGIDGLIVQEVWSMPDSFGVFGEAIYTIGNAAESIKALGRKDISDETYCVVLNKKEYVGRRIHNLDLSLFDFLSNP